MLKNFQFYQKRQRLIKKYFMAAISLLLLFGISVSPISWKNDPLDMIIQSVLITGIICSLVIFSLKESNRSKTLFIILITLYLYLKFWTYPDTSIMLGLFAITPLIPIFLYDKNAFYVTASLNAILGPAFIYLISHTDLRETYQYVALDAFGNTLNFTAIQIILLFVFLGMNNRMNLLKAFHKEMEQAKQLNSIGQLAATIAHEIRNPITVVKGFAQMLEQDKELNDKEHFYVQTMLKELEYTQVIINEYLSLAKPQTDITQVLDVNDEIKKTSGLLSSFANQNNVGISLNLKDDPHVKINPIELKQVLVNIIKNAIESMDAPGYVTVSTAEEGNMARISITDTGRGISKADLEKIGTPFYSLKDRGTGIGLTVCYTTVRKYKGEITVSSQLQKGTTFNIYLPLHS